MTVYLPPKEEPRIFNRDYEKAPEGGVRLKKLLVQRGIKPYALIKYSLCSSEVHGWCRKYRPISKTPRIIAALSKALEVPPALLWDYLLGNASLEDIPPSKAQMRAAIPDSWIKALYPIVTVADQKTISNVLRRLSAKVLSKK